MNIAINNKFSSSYKVSIFYLILLFIVVGSGWFTTRYLGDKARQEILQFNKSTILTHSSYFTGEFEHIEREVKVLSGSPLIAPALIARKDEDIANANSALDRYNSGLGSSVSYLMDSNGMTIASSNRNDPDSFVGKSYQFRPYFIQARKGAPGLYFALGVTSLKRGFYASYPVRDSKDQIIGVVVVKKDIDTKEADLSRYPYFFLVDPNGIIFLSSRKEMTFKSLWPISRETRLALLESGQFGEREFDAVLPREVADGMEIKFDGRNYLASRKVINPEGWSTVIMTSTGKILQYKLVGVITSMWICTLLVIPMIINYRTSRSAKMLRASETRYRELVDNTSSGVAIYEVKDGGKDFILKDFNKAGERIDGARKEDIIGKSIHEVRPGIKEFGLLDVFERVWRTGIPEHHAASFYHDQKIALWHDNFVYKLPTGEMVAVYDDITDRVRAEEALRESQQMLQSVLDTIPVRVFWKDLDSKYLGCNRAFALDAGLQSPEEIIGGNDFETGWAEQADLYISDDRWVMETGIAKLGYEEPQTTPGGDRIWLRTSKVPLFDMKGEIKGVLGTYEDITVDKRAEEALQLSERRLRRAEVVALFGNWEFIPERDKAKASEGAKIIYGLEGREWSISEVQSIPLPEYRGMLDKALNGLIEEGKPYNVEFKIRRPSDGKIVDIHSIAEYSPEKGVVFGVIQDITERKRAEEEIRQTNAYLKTIIENSPDAIAIVDKHGRFIGWNKMAEDLYGYTFEEMRGKTGFDLYEDKDELQKMLVSLRREGSIKKWEMRMQKKDGSIVPFEISIGLLKDSQNETLGSVSVARDLSGIKETLAALRASNDQLNQEIIERKRSEKALKESEERYRVLFEGSNHGILAADIETKRFVFANPSICQMLGYTESELLDLGMQDIHPKDSLKLVLSELESQLLGKKKLSSTLPCLRKDGTVFFVDIAGTSTSIHRRKLAVCFFSDVTERKLAEDALRESEERFSRFFRSTPVGTSITRFNDGLLLDANDAFLGLLSYTREEVIGQNTLELGVWANPGDRAKVLEILQEQGRIRNFETQLVRKSGEIIDVLGSAEVIDIAGEKYMLSLAYDITERKRVEKERKKLEEQLFQAQKMESVGRLAGGVAHDFNNMLSVIIGRAEMALEPDVPTDKLQHNIKEILKAGLRSADLTRQLLAFARKQTAIPKILDLNETISGILKMLRRLIGEDIDLLWVPGLDLWKVKIDPSQVDQILANLVVNARDAISGVGAVTMRTENVVIDDSNKAETPELIPEDYVLLTVSDTGAGMSKEVRENIFEPFFTTKEVGKGTGLGLSTVYGIVKQNDGFIYVASEPGKGTTFKIYLPRFEAETAQVPSEEVAGKRPAGTETILLVEDDKAILDLGKIILENLGYTVLAARTPVDAISLAEEHPGDIRLLITDVVMPEMHGRELAEKLSAIRPDLKCLYMSGYTADVIAHRGILDEGLNFIQKPFGSDDLAVRVRQVLDHLE
jgi:PAS domain S-box-containing protein